MIFFSKNWLFLIFDFSSILSSSFLIHREHFKIERLFFFISSTSYEQQLYAATSGFIRLIMLVIELSVRIWVFTQRRSEASHNLRHNASAAYCKLWNRIWDRNNQIEKKNNWEKVKTFSEKQSITQPPVLNKLRKIFKWQVSRPQVSKRFLISNKKSHRILMSLKNFELLSFNTLKSCNRLPESRNHYLPLKQLKIMLLSRLKKPAETILAE